MSTDLIKYEANAPAQTKKTLAALLENPSIQAELIKVIPKHLTPERLVKMALIAASRQPKLLQCTQGSLLHSVIKSAEMGLDCSGTLGRGYLVPIRNNKIPGNPLEANFWPGYLGLIDLVRNSGELLDITAEVVFKQDTFKIIKGASPDIVHEQDPDNPQDDKDVRGAYMIAWLKNGGRHQHWMNRGQIEKLRHRGKSPNNGPWITDYQAMCKKTVLRQGTKFLPMSVETQQKIAELDREEFDISQIRDTLPETGILSLDDFSKKEAGDVKTEEMPQEEPPTRTSAFGDAPDAFSKPVREIFDARCKAKKYTEAQREEAVAVLFGFLMIDQWADIQTETKKVEAIDWINKRMPPKR